MSLRWKIALSMAAVSLFVSISFGVASYRSTRQQLMSEVDQSLIEIAAAAGGPVPNRNDLSLFDVQVVDTDGVVRSSTLAEPFPVSQREFSVLGWQWGSTFDTHTVEGEQFRTRMVGVPRGGWQYIRSLSETNRVLARLRARTAAFALAITLLAALVGWWLASRVTAPLRRLTAATEHVAATGDLGVAVGTVGDDEVGRLGAGFDDMITALAQSRADQQRLVQDAGHELRTPLTSLKTNISMLIRYPDIPAEQRNLILADLRSEADELTDLVNEVVAVASGELADEAVESVDLTEVANEVAQRFNRRMAHQVSVSPTAPVIVEARPRAVQRAVSCLVDNACKFDSTGGPIEIEVSDRSVTVNDRGPGFGGADPERLFDRFYRAEASRTLPGSGLGLSIVKQVADVHGGSVSAAEREGGGATFALRLGSESEPTELPPPSGVAIPLRQP